MNTILITGANRGIGLECVKAYLADGWKVIALSRHPEKLETLNADPKQLINLKLEVTNLPAIEKIAQQLKELPIDILLNNAGILGNRENFFEKIRIEDEAAWLEMFKVNTIAPFYMTKAFVHHVAQSHLKIIANISSTMGSIGDNVSGGYYFYRSSKSALNMMVKNLSIDLYDKGITVLAIHPGWVKTDMGGPNAQITVEESVEGLRKVLSQITLNDSGKFFRYDGKESVW